MSGKLPHIVSSHAGSQGLLVQEHPELEAAGAKVMGQLSGKRFVLT